MNGIVVGLKYSSAHQSPRMNLPRDVHTKKASVDSFIHLNSYLNFFVSNLQSISYILGTILFLLDFSKYQNVNGQVSCSYGKAMDEDNLLSAMNKCISDSTCNGVKKKKCRSGNSFQTCVNPTPAYYEHGCTFLKSNFSLNYIYFCHIY